MSFIEGIGDEVTAFAVVLLIFLLAASITFFIHTTPHSGISSSLPGNTTSDSPPEQRLEDTSHVNNSQNRSNTEANSYCQVANASGGEECLNTSSDEDYCRKVVNCDDMETDSSSEDIQSSTVFSREGIYPSVSEVGEEEQSFTVGHDLSSPSPSAPKVEDYPSGSEPQAASDTGEIQIRLKYLDDTERVVRSLPTIRIADFKRNHFVDDIANNKVIRLIFSGQLLRDTATLQSYRITENCVVHVQILPAQTEQNNSHISQNGDIDLSYLLWPLLSAILGICWILYFKYPDFFNMMSLGMLFLFTGSFVYFYSQLQQQ